MFFIDGFNKTYNYQINNNFSLIYQYIDGSFGSFYYLPEDASEEMINNMPNIDTNIEDESNYGLIRENDRFNMFVSNSIKYVSEDLLLHPLAQVGDGFYNIFTIPESKGGTRWPLLRFLIKDMDTAELVNEFNDKKSGNVSLCRVELRERYQSGRDMQEIATAFNNSGERDQSWLKKQENTKKDGEQ